MSQIGQANTLQEEGHQRLAEYRKTFEELQARHEAGTISREAFETERKEFEQNFDDFRQYHKRATELAKVEQEIEELRAAPERSAAEPDYRRPMGEGGEPITPSTGETGKTGETEELAADFRFNKASYGVDPDRMPIVTGKTRFLLSNYLRGGRHQAALDNQELLALTSYIDRDGGQVTAAEMRNEVLRQIRDPRYIRSKARIIPTNAASVAFPSFKSTIGMKETRDGKKVDGSDPVDVRSILGKTEFVPAGKQEMVQIPEELVDDQTFDIMSMITEEIAMQAYDDEEKQFLTGTGRNEPYGVLTAPLNGMDTGGSTDQIVPNDIKLLPYELRQAFRGHMPCWMAHKEFYRKVTVMRDDSGAEVNTGNYLFQPGLAPADPDMLNGYMLMESAFFPNNFGTNGATGDPLALFGAWMHYWIVERLDMEVRILTERYAEDGLIGFRYRKRLDAAPVRPEAFVTLDRK